MKPQKEIFFAKHIIVCTGFYDPARMLNMEGEYLSKVKHFYDDVHPYVGKKVIVVGLANSTCDIALELYHKNTEMSMVIRTKEINARVQYWIKPTIENRIKERNITAYFESEIQKIEEDKVFVNISEGKTISDKNDFVLARTSYQPNYNLFKNFGIAIGEDEYKKPIHNPENFETNLPNAYVTEVIKSGMKTNTF